MIDGSSSAEIDVPIAAVWAVVEDVERAPEWQGGMRALRAIERDADGRGLVCEVDVDGRVRTLHSTVRFSYEPPTRLSWTQQRGDFKAVRGAWDLVELDTGRTRARYSIEVDLGRLGFVIRGPLVGLLRAELAGARAAELRRAVEASASSAS